MTRVLHQLTTPICRLGRAAGCCIRHTRRMGGRAVAAGVRVGSVGSVPGQALTREWVSVGYVALYASYSWPTLSQSSTRRTCRWLTAPGQLPATSGPRVQGGRWAVAAAMAMAGCGGRCEQGVQPGRQRWITQPQLAELTHRRLTSLYKIPAVQCLLACDTAAADLRLL